MFVTLEGIDRAGKSTQAKLLADALGADTLLLREPGGTPLAESLRDLLKDPSVEADPRAEMLLFAAARADLVTRVIAPALAEGRHVVCDRFTDSTIAYQGAARGLGEAIAARANELATGGIMPDLTILLKLDPAADITGDRAESRRQAGETDGEDRFEILGDDFQADVAAAYNRLAAAEPERIKIVDAGGTPEEVHARVMAVVEAAAEAASA